MKVILIATVVAMAATAASASAPGERLRVFAMQYHLNPAHVERFDSFYEKMRAFTAGIEGDLATDRPNLVVFNESTGLTTIATGARFAAARALYSEPSRSIPVYRWTEPNGAPAGVVAALASVAAGYAKEIAYYESRFPGLSSKRLIFLAATDTFVRSFYNAFSRIAVELSTACGCEVYVVAGNDMAPFEEVSLAEDPAAAAVVDPEILATGDPVRTPGGSGPETVAYVSPVPEVYNSVFVWAPDGTELGRTSKVNLTPLEGPLLLDLSHASIDQVRPIDLPGTGFRIGIGISLDAFQYGDPPCAAEGCTEAEVCREHPPLQPDPFSHAITAETYMRCLDARGANLFLQPEANATRWAAYSDTQSVPGETVWQPLSWMASDWRAVADPTVGFRWTVVPFMVGNLIDLVFDGQSAVYERGRSGPGAHRIGTATTGPGDPPSLAAYAGDKPETVVLAPWIIGPDDPRYDDRDALAELGARVAPGSGDPLENQQLETVLCVDLDLGAPAAPCD